MIDLLHLPEPDERTVWFQGQDVGWRVWTKPRGVSMVYIYMIGGGGGGGGGAGNNAGATAGGGAGGLNGSMSRFLYPSFTLPDKLYVLAPYGGIGGAGGTLAAGSDGTTPASTYVAVYPNATAGNLVGVALPGLRGFAGTLTGGGGSDFASAGPVATNAPLCQMAATYYFSNREQNNTAGSTGVGIGVYHEGVNLKGAGGGGKTTGSGGAGGGYTVGNSAGVVQWPAIPGGSAETGADASSGFILRGICYGGCGGGGSNTTVGGRGGNGVSWGSGGGGGGGGLTTGGRGGDGGPGLVIISSW